jgi:hypothetical protein
VAHTNHPMRKKIQSKTKAYKGLKTIRMGNSLNIDRIYNWLNDSPFLIPHPLDIKEMAIIEYLIW